ncbi:MAG: hypothetical protein H0U08_02655 [Actinobacteria bacterium]|nr:hypothetical protein [Actinomycetota bacterium]
MRLSAAATAFFVALLVGAAAAPAADIGANDDSAKHTADYGLATYSEMAAVGLRRTVIGVRFRPSQALVIQDKELLDRIVPNALAAGLRVVLAVYPYPPREIEARLASPALFAGYVSAVAQAYPQVTQFVIGNEPNQPAFWRPQFTRSGTNASAPGFGPYLAAAYDALKAIDSTLEVIGVGLSPRGNDKPKAKNNVSTSPVRFLRALGTWYRRSGRTRPLMDSFSFHPYPNRATDPLDRGYPWPNAGFSNLGRVKQALWDAFDGTSQPTTLNGLTIHLDEVGWQVDTSLRVGYQGAENVPVTDEITQAAIYGDLIRRANCDPDVASVSFFGFRDDGLRTGFQAALLRADGTPRPAVAAVQAAIAEADSGCSEGEVPWTPAQEVIDANVEVGIEGEATVTARIAAGEDVRAALCVDSLEVRGIGGAAWRSLRISGAGCQKFAVRGLRPLNVALAVPSGEDVRGDIMAELTAQSNRARTTVVVHQLPTLR